MTATPRIDLSVIICCFNSATRLTPTLQHLLTQRLDDPIRWEVIVVDNGSTDTTVEIARASWPLGHRVPLTIVPEPIPGLSHARRAGIRAARGAVVSFVDDDNWVCEDWIRRLSDLFASHPEIGACGGKGVAVFEESEPPWFGHYQNAFAVGPQGPGPGYVPETRGYLCGAGLSVRRDALSALYDADFQQLNTGRVGKSLIAGEDVEMCLALRLAGWQLYYDPALVYRHYMPSGRMKWSYLRQLQFAHGVAEAKLDHYRSVLRDPGIRNRKKSQRLQAARECYWAALRVLRSGWRSVLRGSSAPGGDTPNLLFLLGSFWGALKSLPHFSRDRERILALADRLQAKSGR